jgi:N-methylhydantoinase A/oxoprolinase/acetone carboxylase beta subunit
MPVALGIDTGGTYTDAVLVDHATGTILAGAKALTTRHDLAVGITGALDAAFTEADHKGHVVDPASIDLVGLSTTLATNAIVEDQGTPVCLILVGYDQGLISSRGFTSDLVTRDVVYIRGGHDGQGDEANPLDEEAVREAVMERRDKVEAFAVSAYFGVRNSAHELRVRQLAEELTGLPVTCGHELTSQLDSVRRATTTALNARLIPLLRELISTVRATLEQRGIGSPLMMVKGDGSLVQADWAMQRPIETILSGPAASVVGAWHLAGRRDGWVVDIGGTTTDIAVLRGGLPRLNPVGAQVGRWRTMIETVDVHTAGLGGDSLVRIDRDSGELILGPRRAVPLCQLAAAHPRVTAELRDQLGKREQLDLCGLFTQTQRLPAALSARETDLLRQLDSRPHSLLSLVHGLPQGLLAVRQIELLENRQAVQRAGFTPTDALHVLGRFSRWDTDAAVLGAELLAIRAGCTAVELCQRVVEAFSRRLSRELVTKALSDEDAAPHWDSDAGVTALLARALGQHPDTALRCRLELAEPVVAVGAPVQAYMPQAAAQLHTQVVIPEHADVANALGAVVNGVVQRLRVLIRPHDVVYRFHLPEGVRDFTDMDRGISHARTVVDAHLSQQARLAGAEHSQIHMTREDRTAPDGYGGDGLVFVESELVFTAVGGPGLSERPMAGTP